MGAREVVIRFIDSYAAGDIEAAFRDFDESFRFHWVAEPDLVKHTAKGVDRDGFIERIKTLHDRYEYISYRPTMIVAEGDHVATQIVIDMRYRGSGRRFLMACAEFWTVKNSRIVELVEYYDTALAASVEGPPD